MGNVCADVVNSGKSESVTIRNEKGRLSPEEIERMVREAEEFAAEDEAQRKRIEALNSLSSFVYSLKTQLGDQEGFGGKISDEDKRSILDTIKETTEWIEEYGQSATAEELEEKLTGELHVLVIVYKLLTDHSAEVQNVVNPITTKLYGGTDYAPGPDDEDDDIFRSHDEL